MNRSEESNRSLRSRPAQVPLPFVLEPLATFESFVVGVNQHVLAHLRAPLPPSSPVYLWGPAGSGKTHLLRALETACRQAQVPAAVLATTATDPWIVPPSARLILLDHVDRLDAALQAQAFAALVEAQSLNIPWIAAGRLPPVDLPLRDDLRTRIGWGHVFAIEPLAEAPSRLVLKREADRRGIRLRDEVVDYLLRRFERDLGSLIGLLDRLDRHAMAQSRDITVPLVRDLLVGPDACEPSAEIA